MFTLRTLLSQTVFALVMLSIAGCEQRPPIEWTEDVKVPDGRIVTVERYQEFKRPSEIGQPPGRSYYWLQFDHPASRERIRWENDGELGTVALLFENEVPYLLVKTVYGNGSKEYGCPNPPYLLFRHAGGQWRNVDLSTFPTKRLLSNMTYGPEDAEKHVRQGETRLGLDYTQALDFAGSQRAWLIDFTLMKEQTFDRDNCSRKRDYLVVRTPHKSENAP